MSEYVKLLPCKCGNRPKVTRFCGWWHIECPRCGFHTEEPFCPNCAPNVTVWGYLTRREAATSWNKAVGQNG